MRVPAVRTERGSYGVSDIHAFEVQYPQPLDEVELNGS